MNLPDKVFHVCVCAKQSEDTHLAFEVESSRFFEPRNIRSLNGVLVGHTSIIPAVAIYPRASEHNMPILIANMRTTLLDKCVSFNETRVYLAR